MARFNTNESRGIAVEEGVQMFDKKTVIVKPWKPDIDVTNEMVENVPIWVRLVGLDINYWGKSALTKIAGMVGNPLKADMATIQKDRLTYARVLIEMPLTKEYPKDIMFENEMGKIVHQKVEYEWKPILCMKCKNFGHDISECRRQLKENEQKHKEEIERNEDGKERNGESRYGSGSTERYKISKDAKNYRDTMMENKYRVD